jgi:hypothetical protein
MICIVFVDVKVVWVFVKQVPQCEIQLRFDEEELKADFSL